MPQFKKVYIAAAILVFVGFVLGYQGGKTRFLSDIAEWWFSVTYKPVVRDTGRTIEMNLRTYHLAADPQKFDTELDSYAENLTQGILLDHAALVLVDVWEDTPGPNDGWNQRMRDIIATRIAPALEAARERGLLIVHAKSLPEESHYVTPRDGEVVLDARNWITDDLELDVILRKNRITTLFYMGFATNICVLDRQYGIVRMEELGYQTILLRDGTASLEYPDTYATEQVKELAGRQA